MQKTDHHTAAQGAEGDVIAQLRPLLTTYAYNITGVLEEARDLVQDAYVRFMQTDTQVLNPKAYLIRTVINLSINRNTQRKRTSYPGEWLPEPVDTARADNGLLGKDVLRYSLMVLLEKLNARERAVFILREAFNYDYAEIAAVLDISTANARQLLSRAKKQLHHHPPAAAQTHDQAFLQRYLDVIHQGDTARLEKLLHEDVTSISDGGGKVAAAIQPVQGKKDVVAFLQGIYRKFYHMADVKLVSINHQPALLYYFNGVLTTCQVFTTDENGVTGVYLIRNPDKLAAIAS